MVSASERDDISDLMEQHDQFVGSLQSRLAKLQIVPLNIHYSSYREHGVVSDMRDAWANARVRKNVSLIHTYHGFKGNKQGAVEFLKLIFRAFCLCWDCQT